MRNRRLNNLGHLWTMAYGLWPSGGFAIKATVCSHASAYQKLATQSAESPEGPEWRALKRTVAALHFLPRATAITGEVRLTPVRFRPRRDPMPLSRGALASLFLFSIIALSACDSGTEPESVSSDDQLKVQIEAAIASTADVPQGLNVEVIQGKAVISGSLNCEDCAGMRTPANFGSIQQSLGAIVRAVPGISDVEFSLVSGNTE